MTVPKVLDKIHAVTDDSAAPESITYVPNLSVGDNYTKFVRLLGLETAFRAAKGNDYNIDVGVIDAALLKTRLSPADKIQAKIQLLGSGFAGKAF